jgi:Fe-S-cluster containining protein
MTLSIRPTLCKCHPETCGGNPWSVYDDNKKLVSFFHKEDAKIYMLELIIKLNEDVIKDLTNKIENIF